MLVWFALATYRTQQGTRTALKLKDALYDLVQAAELLAVPAERRGVLIQLDAVIANWEQYNTLLADIAAGVDAGTNCGDLRPLTEADAPLTYPYQPFRIFGAASNYIEHAEEMATKLAAKADSTPFIFMKSQSSIVGPNDNVVIPPETKKADWEVELGVVIGRGGRRIPVDKALDHIAGYTVVNDVSARDLTRRTDFSFSHDWFRGKSFDSFTPIGPWFVPRDCIADLHNLKLTLDVNGERMQDGNSGEMIFNSFEQIAYLSNLLTLRPGDLLATGTPAGVGMGRGIFLKPGDVMVAAIEGIGELRNPVTAE